MELRDGGWVENVMGVVRLESLELSNKMYHQFGVRSKERQQQQRRTCLFFFFGTLGGIVLLASGSTGW